LIKVKKILLKSRRVLAVKEVSSLIMLLAVIVTFYILSPLFLSLDNIKTILEIVPELGIMVVGVAVLMISGEFDLSVGSVFALPSIIMVQLINSGMNLWPATILAMALCLLAGLLNGIITLGLGIPSFITTLGTMMIWRGVVLLITQGWPPFFPEEASPLTKIIVGELGFVRLSLIWFVVIIIFFWILLERSRFGNWTFATGGNPGTARALGISTKRVKGVNFMISSFLAGFSGLIQGCRLQAVLPSAGTGVELQAIAAAVIGGTFLTGGIGSVVGSSIGCFLIRIIDNGLVMAGAPGYWFRIFIGIILIRAVVLNLFIIKKASKMR
jgi:simple sugar transport system permease protein